MGRPEVAPFVRTYRSHISSISPDGKRTYFSALKPVNEGEKPRYDYWIAEKTEDGWGSHI